MVVSRYVNNSLPDNVLCTYQNDDKIQHVMSYCSCLKATLVAYSFMSNITTLRTSIPCASRKNRCVLSLRKKPRRANPESRCQMMYYVPTKMMTKSNTWYVILIVFEGYASGVQLHEQYHYVHYQHSLRIKKSSCVQSLQTMPRRASPESRCRRST